MIKKLLFCAMLLAGAMTASAAIPSVMLKDIDGRSIDTAELYNDGNPIVISFWASWCKPCIRELNAIKEVYDDWQDETGVKVVAVSIDQAQDVEKVKPIVSRMGWDYDVLLDANSEFKRQMGVSDPPHVFVVDGDGNIVWNHQGYVDGSEEEILEAVKKAMKK
ncbi:MAG: TlpA family protein disulfide reductase [Muribaculaceae bacterium]|nr:TlpA family protein disulfide reductase [Muribaculaceae bacterium]